MKFSEDILKAFDLEPEEIREPVNIMQIHEMLEFMKVCAERIDQKSRYYRSCDNADIQMDCIDIVTVKLNDFAQVFMDLVIFLRKQEGTYKGSKSLRYCIVSFDTFDFVQTESEKVFLRELLLRNEITHDYFNREMHQQKLIWIMMNCSHGGIDVYKNLYDYCVDHDLLENIRIKIRNESRWRNILKSTRGGTYSYQNMIPLLLAGIIEEKYKIC